MLPSRRAAVVCACALLLGSAAEGGPLASDSLSILLTNQSFVYPATGATGTAASLVAASLASGSAFNGSATVILTGTAATKSPVDRVRAFITHNGAGSGRDAGRGRRDGELPGSRLPERDRPDERSLPDRAGAGRSADDLHGDGRRARLQHLRRAGQATVTGVQLTELTTGGGTQMATSRAFTGMNALTPGGAGTLTLVSPGKVYVSTGNKIPLVGTLTLQYAPEPGTALLTGAGALGLALLARRRGCVPEPVRTSRRRADRGGR
jgi:hypothetical protein